MPNPDHPYILLAETCRRYHATLVVVSKTRTQAEIEKIYRMGQRIFAENRAQDLIEKVHALPADIEWHLIGHLQTNKVRSILPYVECIQSLDRINLWDKLQEEAVRLNKKVRCLLQIKIAREETKFGWSFDQLDLALGSGMQTTHTNVVLGGVMGMASLTADTNQVRSEMRQLKNCYDLLKEKYFSSHPDFNTISMGMSGDYQIALEEGSTMVRVGSMVFNG